jgi:hypothetical protein
MRYLLCLVGLGMLYSPAKAELIYITANSVYTQSFDTLPNSGVNHIWANDATLAGWYSTSSTLNASSGAASIRTLYSFGVDSTPERALGIVSQGTASDAQFGLAIRNESGVTLKSFNVRFDGEQWRRSTTNIPAPQTLLFGYRTSTTLGTISAAPYTDVSALGFTSPGFSLPGGPTNGNDSVNRTSNIAGSINGLAWNPGEYLWLRWQNENNGLDSKHGLGIDNFSFSASESPGNITAVPEPSSLMLVSVAGWLAFRYRRRLKTPT